MSRVRYFQPTAERDASGLELAPGYVTVERELTAEEIDRADVGRMFAVRYVTPARLYGQCRHAFADELERTDQSETAEFDGLELEQ